MRGRNNRSKGPNPLTRSYESNGPDVKIRGTAQHVADKYAQLARDAQASGDPVAAENYFQHAEHYYRIIATAQEALRQQYGYQRPFDEDGEEGDEEGFGYGQQGGGPPQPGDEDFGSQPQPFEGRGGEQQPRFDRPYGQDRGERQDRGDRQDRNDRPDQRFNRGDNRGDRHNRGGERFDRGPERQDRGGGDRQDRGERQDRGDRFQQPRPPRQDFQNGAPRHERQARQDRGDFGRDRAPREEPEAEVNGALPAFLTTPVRTPIAIDEGEGRDAAGPAVAGAPDDAAAAPNGAFGPRRRRRRRPFEGGEGSDPASDFAPEAADTPPAE